MITDTTGPKLRPYPRLIWFALSMSVYAMLGFATTGFAQETKPKKPKRQLTHLKTGGERDLDIAYKSIGNKKLRLDLYYPTGGKDAGDRDPNKNVLPPVVIYTHGGGWAAGSKLGVSKGLFKPVFLDLLSKGFAVASVGYRLCKPDTEVTMRDCVIDCKDAVRYLAQNSENLKIDTERFFMMGDSAGGQIAQMLTLSASGELPGDADLAGVPYKIVAGVSWYGPCDFEKVDLFNHDDRANFRDRFGPRIVGSEKDPDTKLALYREMSPINYLKPQSPPLLMIQGDKDTTIPVKHAYHMQQKAEAIEAPVEIMIVKNSGHNWRTVGAPIEPTRAVIAERTVKFFVDHLPK